MSELFLDRWQAMRHLVMDDIVAHLPDYKILYSQVPIFAQAILLSLPRQTDAIRLMRMALIPFGLFYSYKMLQYDFLPRDSFRLQNWLKNIATLPTIQRTLELGLAKASDRPKWIGFDGEKRKQPEHQDEIHKHVSLLDWRSPVYAMSLLGRCVPLITMGAP